MLRREEVVRKGGPERQVSPSPPLGVGKLEGAVVSFLPGHSIIGEQRGGGAEPPPARAGVTPPTCSLVLISC